MDAAQQAINKLFSSDQRNAAADETVAPVTEADKQAISPADDPALADTTLTKDEAVVPAVEHETIRKEHETQEEKVIDKERHQHHYHTTVQPLEDSERLPTKVDQETAPTEVYEYNHDDGEDVKGNVDARNAGFQSTTEEGKTFETTTKGETVAGEHVHHHVHETIQPVIQKETVDPYVTQKKIPVKEIYQEQSEDHGVTTLPTKSVDEFQRRLDGESRTTEL